MSTSSLALPGSPWIPLLSTQQVEDADGSDIQRLISMGEQWQPCLLYVVPAQNLLQKFIHSNVTGCSFLSWEVKTKQELKMECSEPSGSDAVPTRRAGNFSNPCHAGGGTKGSLSTLAASGWRYRRKGCAAISLSKEPSPKKRPGCSSKWVCIILNCIKVELHVCLTGALEEFLIDVYMRNFPVWKTIPTRTGKSPLICLGFCSQLDAAGANQTLKVYNVGLSLRLMCALDQQVFYSIWASGNLSAKWV